MANSGRDFKYEEALKQQDQDAHVALNFLSERVYRLFSVGKEEGQHIEFRHRTRVERSSSEDASQDKPSINANSKPHLKQKDRRKKAKPLATEQPAPLSSGDSKHAVEVCQPKQLNKRDKMKLALAAS